MGTLIRNIRRMGNQVFAATVAIDLCAIQCAIIKFNIQLNSKNACLASINKPTMHTRHMKNLSNHYLINSDEGDSPSFFAAQIFCFVLPETDLMCIAVCFCSFLCVWLHTLLVIAMFLFFLLFCLVFISIVGIFANSTYNKLCGKGGRRY